MYKYKYAYKYENKYAHEYKFTVMHVNSMLHLVMALRCSRHQPL